MREIEAGYTGFELAVDPTSVNLTTQNYLTATGNSSIESADDSKDESSLILWDILMN